MREIARSMLLSAPGRLAARVVARPGITILMLHRFSDRPTDAAYGRHSPVQLRALLASLRKSRAALVPLACLCSPEEAPASGVVFTVDDGFADFGVIAWPVFRDFDCPVTVFLTTGFVDGAVWPWWEQVSWAFARTRQSRVRMSIGGQPFDRSLASAGAARVVAAELTEMLKQVPDAAREAALAAIPVALSVELPSRAPDEDTALTWADVRKLGSEGVTFGPHTVTHPILSRVDDARAGTEIAGSWRRLRAETDATVPVFCYPNGDPGSFGPREQDLVAREGMGLALSTVPGHVRRADLQPGGARRYALPRFACPHEPRQLAWITSGWGRH